MAQDFTSERGIRSLPARFWSKVDVRGKDECWPWTAGVSSNGYGAIGIGSKVVSAHRASYWLHNGEFPVADGHHGGVVMHTCDNRLCCNPYHLVSGDQSKNLADMRVKGRNNNIGPRGELARTAVLTSDVVLEIRSRLSEGEAGVVLADEYGISPSTVSQIRLRKSWKHI